MVAEKLNSWGWHMRPEQGTKLLSSRRSNPKDPTSKIRFTISIRGTLSKESRGYGVYCVYLYLLLQSHLYDEPACLFMQASRSYMTEAKKTTTRK